MNEKNTSELHGVSDETILLDFEHLAGGRNCMTSSLWKLLHHTGVDISEEMLVGIASGLGFIYWKMKQLKVPFVGGMNGGRFPTILGLAVDRLGGEWNVLKTASAKRAHLQMKDVLRMNQPALVCVDMAYLDYLSLGGENEDHFGMHTILVYGIDEKKNEALVSDRFSTPITMRLSDLQKARDSKHHPFPALNKLLTIKMPETLTPLEDIIPMAIRENTKFMLDPPIRNMGLKGILKWKEELAKYQKLLAGPAEMVQALTEHYVYIEVGGSGGALFRRMYTDFLQESSDLMNDSTLRSASASYSKISDCWSEIANLILPESSPALSSIRSILWDNNVDLEKDGVKAFDKVKNRLSVLPKLYNKAQAEVAEFDKFITPVLDCLEKVYELEYDAMTLLDEWAAGFS